MPQIISVVNQKGGVGKTTTAINLGSYLARNGKFVLLIDMDPQANATSGLGINHADLKNGIYDALMGLKSFKDVVIDTSHTGFRIAPANINLAGAAVELVNEENREFKLREGLLEIKNDYDYIIIDNPPSLGLLTLNGLVASDEVVIPVQAEYFALEGLGQLLNTINLVKERLNQSLNILGVVVTMYDKRNKLSGEVLKELEGHFPEKIFKNCIPRNVKLAEAPSHGKSILEYDPSSSGAKAYENLVCEILNKEAEILKDLQ